jgi:hypothetical protein
MIDVFQSWRIQKPQALNRQLKKKDFAIGDSAKLCEARKPTAKPTRSLRLVVRTSGSHPENTGSTPVGITIRDFSAGNSAINEFTPVERGVFVFPVFICS